MSYGGPDAVMSERPNYYSQNRQFLLTIIMNQLGITEDDLEKDPSWIKSKVREANIDKVLED